MSLFISMEGLDGTGKTVQASMLTDRLRTAGVRVVLVREPGGTPLGEQVRALLKDPRMSISSKAELLLFNAARAQLVETTILPSLLSGATVIADRFLDSTIAYQGYGRGLLDGFHVGNIISCAIGDTLPNLTLLLEAPIEVRQKRCKCRETTDRIELEGRQFFSRVEEGFRQVAEMERRRVVRINASGAIEHVHEAIWAVVSRWTPDLASEDDLRPWDVGLDIGQIVSDS